MVHYFAEFVKCFFHNFEILTSCPKMPPHFADRFILFTKFSILLLVFFPFLQTAVIMTQSFTNH